MVLPFLILGLAALGVGGYYFMNRRGRGSTGTSYGGGNNNGMSANGLPGTNVDGMPGYGGVAGAPGGIGGAGGAGGVGGDGVINSYFAYAHHAYPGFDTRFRHRPWDNLPGYGVGNVHGGNVGVGNANGLPGTNANGLPGMPGGIGGAGGAGGLGATGATNIMSYYVINGGKFRR